MNSAKFGFRCMACTGDREIPRSQEEGFSIKSPSSPAWLLDIGDIGFTTPAYLGIPWVFLGICMRWNDADNSRSTAVKWPEITTASALARKIEALPTDGHMHGMAFSMIFPWFWHGKHAKVAILWFKKDTKRRFLAVLVNCFKPLDFGVAMGSLSYFETKPPGGHGANRREIPDVSRRNHWLGKIIATWAAHAPSLDVFFNV